MGIGVMWPCKSDIMLDKVLGHAPFLIVSTLYGTDICQNGPRNTIECGKSKKKKKLWHTSPIPFPLFFEQCQYDMPHV